MARALSFCLASSKFTISFAIVLILGLAVESYAQPPQGRGRFQGRGGQAASQSPSTVSTVAPIPTEWADNISWRSIGPANMSGRITSIAVYEKDPNIWWASSASGGLLKTINNGVTFEHQFDDQDTVSIGEVAVSQIDPNVVWVGTGENNPRNSVSWGDGVYKSTDGGKTWKNMGLKKTFQTGAIAIHPKDHDTVYVGSLGRLWGPNEDRGLYKTTDGGATWNKILYVDDKTGVIDVRVNPKKPDELLVATYERQRDGFDGNDPMTKYGEGSGIYKSTDGGESFTKITEGLPTCKLGRIGLDYYHKNPNYVYAVIESEKIAKKPDTFPFVGARANSDSADVGARIGRITKDSPADKAGLVESDIVVSINGAIIHSFDEMMNEAYKHQAGDKVKLVVSRDRKTQDVVLELGKAPAATNGRSRGSNPFTGTLGGQSANKQEMQGEAGHEYGGIYMSKDGGSTWQRINSLNPRPMYYSHIRVDPSDKNYIYVCGTSLYKSSDGGKTFTGDGGSDGIHVDHHALWINPRDGRHMILGCDGGLHVTHDRMTHWEHLNKIAIGQFYHVGVGPNLNYRVYGGLQDNGSWGGPSRTTDGFGAVNSDWFRVGGGDGFITLVDPYDADQIYYESQNGGMGRTNMRTGERGFIRPRPPRGSGIKYRFNWKSPFILSPHNSKVFFSAGNYVFKSYNKGDRIEAISPEITNTDKGSGSAISQSHVDAKIIYAGTTDGAVWMTKDGGKEWIALYSKKEAADESKSDRPAADGKDPSGRPAADKPDASGQSSEEKSEEETETDESMPESAAGDDPVTGNWTGAMIIPNGGGEREFAMTLKLDADGKVSGSVEGRQGDQEFEGGTFNKETGAIAWEIEGGRGSRSYSGTIKDGNLEGELQIGDRFTLEFTATRDKQPAAVQAAGLLSLTNPIGMIQYVPVQDPISGEWAAVIENENIPNGRMEFTLDLKLKDGKVTGESSSPQGEMEISEGEYDAEKKILTFYAERDEFGVEFEATVTGDKMEGTLEIAQADMSMDFSATRTKQAEAAPAAPPAQAKQDPVKPEPAKATEPAKTEEPAKATEPAKTEEKPAAEKTDAANQDVVSGVWTGEMESRRGVTDFKMTLKRESDQKITGSYETERFDSEISGGTYDPKTKQLTLTAENNNFSIDIEGKIADGKFEGQMQFNGGQFSMEITATRTTSAPVTAAAQNSQQRGNRRGGSEASAAKPLAELMPGPRWVSSLDASHFKAERVYASFDGHRSDDDGVYVFVSDDHGANWTSLKSNLPDTAGSVRVIREDIENENLLFLGCEFSAWFSVDRGQSWTRFTGLPTVAVHEFAIHPKAGEIVAATHGRSLWIADVRVLRQMSKDTITADAFLYQPGDIVQWTRGVSRGRTGIHEFRGKNPSSGTKLCYSLGKNARDIELTISDLKGDVIRRFDDAPTTKGFHAIDWDLRRASRNAGNRGGGRGRGFGGATLPKGSYLVTLKVDGKTSTEVFSLKPDPTAASDAIAVDEELEFWLEMLEAGGENDQ